MEQRNFIRLNRLAPGDHICESREEGDEIVFTCPHCPGYERRVDKVTGKIISTGAAGNRHKHHGAYIKPVLRGVECSMN